MYTFKSRCKLKLQKPVVKTYGTFISYSTFNLARVMYNTMYIHSVHVGCTNLGLDMINLSLVSLVLSVNSMVVKPSQMSAMITYSPINTGGSVCHLVFICSFIYCVGDLSIIRAENNTILYFPTTSFIVSQSFLRKEQMAVHVGPCQIAKGCVNLQEIIYVAKLSNSHADDSSKYRAIYMYIG